MAIGDYGTFGMPDIAERLRLTREALGYTQVEIARLAGASGGQAWNNYESGRRRINVDHALALCQSIGVSLDWIYLGDRRNLHHDLALKIRQVETAGAHGGAKKRKRA